MAALIRAFANLANELDEAGYTAAEIGALKDEVRHYENIRQEVKLSSGDYIDLKMYEPAMRHLIDAYIRAEESQKVAAFDDLSLVQLIVERGAEAVNALPKGIRENKEAVAETIENNVRKSDHRRAANQPKVLREDVGIARRPDRGTQKAGSGLSASILKRSSHWRRRSQNPTAGESYPKTLNTGSKRALYDNLDQDETLALAVDTSVRENMQDDWRSNAFKIKKVMFAIKAALQGDDALTAKILELVKNQRDY